MNTAIYTVVSVVFLLVFIWVGIIEDAPIIRWSVASVVAAVLWPLALITMTIMYWRTKQ